MALAGQPVEHGLGGSERGRTGGNPELDERDEPPVRARPLLVRMRAEAAVRLLPVEERSNDRAREDRLRIGLELFAEDVSPRQERDRRLVGLQKPLGRREASPSLHRRA